MDIGVRELLKLLVLIESAMTAFNIRTNKVRKFATRSTNHVIR